MVTASSSRIAGSARVAAGLTLASYIIAHPLLCWSWIQNQTISSQIRLFEYVVTLSLVSVAAGFLRGISIGVYLPVYGFWHPPFFDALAYYLVLLMWCVGVILGGSLLLRALGARFGSTESGLRLWFGLLAFSATPFLLSGVLVLIPSEVLRFLLSLGSLYGLFLFRRGVEQLDLIPQSRQSAFCVTASILIIAFGAASLSFLMSILMPSYPVRMLSEPVLSQDVLDFKLSLEQLGSRQ